MCLQYEDDVSWWHSGLRDGSEPVNEVAMSQTNLLVSCAGQHYPLLVGHTPFDEDLLPSLLFHGLLTFALFTSSTRMSIALAFMITRNDTHRSFSRSFSPWPLHSVHVALDVP